MVFRRLGSAVLVAALCIALIEMFAPFVGNNEYYWSARYAFISPDSYRYLGDNLWTYRPNAMVSTVTSYQLAPSWSWIESRCHFTANRFGLIDTNVHDADTRVDFLVLGDSFTEGQGGCPWLTRTSTAELDAKLLNGGLQGAGIAFSALLEQWVSNQTEVSNIVVIAISNDFIRLPRQWEHSAQNAQNICTQGERCSPQDFWWELPEAVLRNDADVLRQTEGRFSKRSPDKSQWLYNVASYYSLTFRLASRYYELLAGLFRTQVQYPYGAELDTNFRALAELRRRYPNMKVILIPQRDEVGLLGNENLETQIVRKHLEEIGLAHRFCVLSIGDYLPIDGHPNAIGYGKIRACLFDELAR